MQLNPSSGSPSRARSSDPAPTYIALPGSAPRFLSVVAVAEVLGMSDVTLYRAIHGNQFPAIKIRGRYVIPAKVLDAMEDAALSSGAMVDASDWVDGRGVA